MDTLKEQIDMYSEKHGITITDYIMRAITLALKNNHNVDLDDIDYSINWEQFRDMRENNV